MVLRLGFCFDYFADSYIRYALQRRKFHMKVLVGWLWITDISKFTICVGFSRPLPNKTKISKLVEASALN